MAEVERMKIESQDHKRKPLKRKRPDPCSFSETPDEKTEKINKFRDEIGSLVKFGKELVLENRGVLLENVGKIGDSSLDGVIACLMEESDLPLPKIVDEIFEKVKGKTGNEVENVSRASVNNSVLRIGHRLCYGVTAPDADVLEDESESALWCWETRDLNLLPKLARVSVKDRRSCRKKIHERITALLAVINALEKSEDHRNRKQNFMKASEKLGKVLDEADIRLLAENLSQKNVAEMAEKEAKKNEILSIKDMERNKRESEKERKKIDRELQIAKMKSEKELKRREKEEHEIQKQLKKQQEEAEKDKKRKEKEEAEQRKQLALQKQKSIMERFLKPSKTNAFQHNSPTSKQILSEITSTMADRISGSVTCKMDSVLAQNCGTEAEILWRSHLDKWRCAGREIVGNRKMCWGIRLKPKTKLVKELKLTTNKDCSCVDGCVDLNADEGLSQPNMRGPFSEGHKRSQSRKLLQFDENHRPAFCGVWPRKSKVIGLRRPFVKDPDIEYEIDSDDEWEEDEPGESLSDCDKDDEDEAMEESLISDEEDETEDGFFVPDGYLSENEGSKIGPDESPNQVKERADYEKEEVDSEEFCNLLRQQKHLNNFTEHALRKNNPLIVLNLMHEKTSLVGEELAGTEKVERICLQALSIRPFPGSLSVEMPISNNAEEEDIPEASSSFKSENSPLATAAAIHKSDLPQFVSVIQSSPQNIRKIVELLQNNFPAFSKSQLKRKVQEISELSENCWQVKREILSELGLSVSPGRGLFT